MKYNNAEINVHHLPPDFLNVDVGMFAMLKAFVSISGIIAAI